VATTNEVPLAEVTGEAPVALEGLDTLHALLEAFWTTVNSVMPDRADARWRALFDSAVGEIAGNIVRHAYPEVQPAERFRISFACFPDRMRATMLDRGTPYVLIPATGIPDMREALLNADLDHGWGLPIAHAASDDLEYTRQANGDNRWVITKRLPEPGIPG
jgi:anti-sigma regulatory factor (Ser/Thr protein kinase)